MNKLQPRVILALLSATRAYQVKRCEKANRQSGFSLAVVIIVALAVILGSAAIASRATSGYLSAALQGNNRQAREIAEAGIVQIISDLNQERNRKLLVAGTPASGTALDSWASSADFQNPCSNLDASGNPIASGTSLLPDPNVVNYKNTSKAIAGGTFKLEKVEYSNIADRSALPPFSSPSPQSLGSAKSLIKITVTGQAANSRSVVTREFEVVPKCCKRSFSLNINAGVSTGNDKRPCFPTSAGLGFIVQNNGGVIDTTKNTFAITDENNIPITKVLCVQGAGSAACDAGTQVIGSAKANITVSPALITITIPSYPGTATASSFTDNSTGNNSTVLRVKPDLTEVERCRLNNKDSVYTDCAPAASCEKPASTSNFGIVTPQFFCRFSSIDISNSLVVDTSNGVINIFTELATNPSAAPATTLYLGGGGVLSHYNCGSTTGVDSCTTNAGFSNVEKLNIFAPYAGTIDLKGDGALALNIYAPKVNLSANGGGASDPNFLGRIWVNGLDLKGGISMKIPNSTASFTGAPSGSNSTPVVDWVARGNTASSAF